MSMSDEKLRYYLVDYENCIDIEKEDPKLSTWYWIEHIKETEKWTKLIEMCFDENQLKVYFENVSQEERENFFEFAVSCVISFVQRNFTGPDLPKEVGEFFSLELFSKTDFSKLLALNNEDININTEFPQLLAAAKVIFQTCQFNETLNLWWMWRVTLIHQQILDELSPTLLSISDRLRKEIAKLSLTDYTKAKLEIELAQLYILYRNVPKAALHIAAASCILGIQYEMTGKLGKRTKFQEKETAQLSLEVTLQEKEGIERPPVNDFNIPKNLELKDDVRLETVSYSENSDIKYIFPDTEQKLLLLIIQEMMGSKPRDELFYEEIEPFINSILDQKNTWTVRVATLLLRCKLEGNHNRTIERSLQQCEEILNSIRKDQPHPLNRIGGVFATGLQPFWKTLGQYADLMLNLGMIKRSLDVYLQLHLWEEVIVCYTILKMRQKSAEIIKQELDKKPTVKLWCLLGDATDDVTCYEKAWQLSKRRSHRAQRHWGQYFFSRKQYQECIPHFEKSVSINPLQTVVWLRLGFAALETENWQAAATAYRRYTTLEPDGFEAWNNLAQAYIKLGNKRSAHQALTDALRCNFENWKVWENLLVVSTDIGHYSDVIKAYHRLLDLKEKYLNVEVLGELVYGVCNNVNDYEGKQTGHLLQKTRELLGRVTAIYPGEGQLWELYASLAPVLSLRTQRLQRAYRGYTQGSWDKNPVKCQQVLHVCHKLAEVALDDRIDPMDSLVNSVRLNLSSAIAAVKKQDWEISRNLIQEVSVLLGKLIEKSKLGKSLLATKEADNEK